jgi:hypothetical protein
VPWKCEKASGRNSPNCLNEGVQSFCGTTIAPFLVVAISSEQPKAKARRRKAPIFPKEILDIPKNYGPDITPDDVVTRSPKSTRFKSQLLIFAGALIALTSMGSAAITNEFWVSTSTNTANLGTQSNPYDGSTQPKFDAVINHLSANATLHILGGTYQTYGDYDCRLKSGQRILGSGIDVTILQLPKAAPSPYATSVVGSEDGATNIQVSDLTCDANFTSGALTYYGIHLDGTSNAIRRVKVVRIAGFNTNQLETFGIMLHNDKLPASGGNIIDSCVVSNCAGSHQITAIGLSGGASGTWISGIVSNNSVYLLPDPIGAQFGINLSWATGCLVKGNYVDGADVGCYGDTGGTTNVAIFNNAFTNCYQGVRYQLTARNNITIASNTISLNGTSYAYPVKGIWLESNCYTNIAIRANRVGFDNHQTTGASFLDIETVNQLNVADNMVDSSLTNRIIGTGLLFHGNHDLSGNNYLSGGLEPPTSLNVMVK